MGHGPIIERKGSVIGHVFQGAAARGAGWNVPGKGGLYALVRKDILCQLRDHIFIALFRLVICVGFGFVMYIGMTQSFDKNGNSLPVGLCVWITVGAASLMTSVVSAFDGRARKADALYERLLPYRSLSKFLAGHATRLIVFNGINILPMIYAVIACSADIGWILLMVLFSICISLLIYAVSSVIHLFFNQIPSNDMVLMMVRLLVDTVFLVALLIVSMLVYGQTHSLYAALIAATCVALVLFFGIWGIGVRKRM